MILKTNLFKIQHSDLKPETGSVLISEPFLTEAYFQRAVILLVEYHTEGSMGLVLNKPTGVILNDLIEGLDTVEDIPVYCGGPVRHDRLFYLHTLGDLIPGSLPIGDQLYIDGDFETLLAYIRCGNKIKGRIRFFMGYSGWEHQQLLEEIRENAWLVAENKTLPDLSGEGDDFWRQTLMKQDRKYAQWLNYPKEPYLN
ncbi:MAG: YqgE/AlgH family protein [Bacteroidales bacterium]